MLAPFRKIISNNSYKLEIKYLPELKDNRKFLNRNEAYEIVKKYWDPKNYMNNYVNYMIVGVK